MKYLTNLDVILLKEYNDNFPTLEYFLFYLLLYKTEP